jgi:hypothetical protein
LRLLTFHHGLPMVWMTERSAWAIALSPRWLYETKAS